MKKNIKHIFITVILFFMGSCITLDTDRPPYQHLTSIKGEIEWVKSFGGSKTDVIQKIIETKDGGYAMIGYSNSKDGDLAGAKGVENNYWVVKLDTDGNKQWSKNYGGAKDDKGQSILQTKDGGFVVVGYAMSGSKGMHDVWAFKINNSGTMLWEKKYGFAGHDHGYDLVPTDDGGFLIAGFLDVTAAKGKGNYGVAYDRFNTVGQKKQTVIKNSSNGNVHGVGEYWALKIDKDGTLIWSRFFGGTNNERSYAIAKSWDGGFVLTGFSESDDFDIGDSKKGSYDFWCIKINDKGAKIWERSFGGSGIDEAFDITRTPDQAYIVVGKTFSDDKQVGFNLGNSDMWVIKISDRSGELIWSHNLGGTAFDKATAVVADKNSHNVFVVGSTKSDLKKTTQKGGSDVLVAQLDNRNGKLIWYDCFSSSLDDEGLTVLRDKNNAVVLAGTFQNADFYKNLTHKGEKDVFVMKLK